MEVILTEKSSFAQAYELTIEDLMNFLDLNGLQIYDIALQVRYSGIRRLPSTVCCVI